MRATPTMMSPIRTSTAPILGAQSRLGRGEAQDGDSQPEDQGLHVQGLISLLRQSHWGRCGPTRYERRPPFHRSTKRECPPRRWFFGPAASTSAELAHGGAAYTCNPRRPSVWL